jgi:hypothetical protein
MDGQRDTTVELLKRYYDISDMTQKPPLNMKSRWNNLNKFGFLLGVIRYGKEVDISELHTSLHEQTFHELEGSIIQRFYEQTIFPFKQHTGNGSSCETPPSSPQSSRWNLENGETELNHHHFKREVAKRDGACLSCWREDGCHAAHIIAQKNSIVSSVPESSLFTKAGLTSTHQVQNGLLLCSSCHAQFNRLTFYIEFADDKFILKVVNFAVKDTKDREWERALREIQALRHVSKDYLLDTGMRDVVNSDGEMGVFFMSTDTASFPNNIALDYHKAACLIWQMAGGAEPEEEFCPCNDDGDDNIILSIEKVQNWLSSETLVENTMDFM